MGIYFIRKMEQLKDFIRNHLQNQSILLRYIMHGVYIFVVIFPLITFVKFFHFSGKNVIKIKWLFIFSREIEFFLTLHNISQPIASFDEIFCYEIVNLN